MSDLDPKLSMHHLSVRADKWIVKQELGAVHPDLTFKI